MPEGFKLIEILLVEDSPDDAFFTKEAFAKSKVKNNLSIVEDGVEALKYLKKQHPYEHVARPDIVLLDLNLPKKSGIDVLKEIRADDSITDIPVIILTTSSDEVDVMRSYRLHANCYITKPVDFHKFTDVVVGIEGFWFGIVTLPS